jgi:serine protease Do
MRLGRIIAMRDAFLQSDCPLMPGDSGGPLFDLDGNVIAVHSRIGPRTSLNLHVSAALFARDWQRLLKPGDASAAASADQAMIGVNGEDDPEGARITSVFRGLPAHAAGLQIGDVITHLAGTRVEGFGQFQQLVRVRRPGEIVELRVLRGAVALELRARLVARPAE